MARLPKLKHRISGARAEQQMFREYQRYGKATQKLIDKHRVNGYRKRDASDKDLLGYVKEMTSGNVPMLKEYQRLRKRKGWKGMPSVRQLMTLEGRQEKATNIYYKAIDRDSNYDPFRPLKSAITVRAK